MKRLFAILLLCTVVSIPAWAQTKSSAKEKQTPQMGTTMQGQVGPGMMGSQQMMNQMMPMMQQCQMMTGRQNMISQEMLSMMKDIVKMQEKMLANPNESEKQQMVQDMTNVMERIDRHMSMLNQMTGGQTTPKQQKQSEPGEKESK